MKQVTTVAGVIKNAEGKILCTQREQGKYDYISYKWEFPGGKIEEGETKEQTLARELMEELNLEVEIQDFFYQVEHDYPDFHLSMTVFNCFTAQKELSMNVHKSLKWLYPEEMKELDWAAADVPIAKKIIENDGAK